MRPVIILVALTARRLMRLNVLNVLWYKYSHLPHYNNCEVQPIPRIPQVGIRVKNKSTRNDFKDHFRRVNKRKNVPEGIKHRAVSR